jgi:serine protease Do
MKEILHMTVSTTKKSRVLGLLAAGLLSATALTTASLFAPTLPVYAETQPVIATSNQGYADLVDKVMPAVISVEVKFANVANNDQGDMDDDDGDDQQRGMPNLPEDSPFRDFFKQFPQFKNGMPNQEQRPRGGMGQGSGFIITADGYAVTNNHVVQDADEVMVKMNDGEEYKAKVIGTDPKTDLALIKIDGDKPFNFVKFSTKETRVGDVVIAVGNPFGLGGTVTSGIISARGRDIGSGPYDDFLQIDASINRGNSGGPAFDLEGNVVGINTAIFSPSGGSVGIGFAIPASTAQDVIASLKDNGTVTRGWLGVQIQPVTEDIAESMSLSVDKGAIVADVTDESPALAAGIKTGDTITKVNGQVVSDPRDLAKKVARLAPGKPVELELIRDGKTMNVEVEIGKMPTDKQASAEGTAPSKTSLSDLGLKLAPGNDGDGVAVVEVKPGSPAEEKGLKSGDVILEVAGKEVHDPADVTAAVGALKDGKQKRVLMLVRSGTQQRFVAVPVAKG